MAQNRPSNPNKFFTKEEKSGIVKAIREAEKATSGEIRLHLERKVSKDLYQRAQDVFKKIGMTRTAQRNGVLIYLATDDRKFAVIGDRGINDVVPENFWEDIVSQMTEQFKKCHFFEGVCGAVQQIGEKLKQYFPYQPQDVNELPDEISLEQESDKPDD
jgi:uncharacterized membrane protein